MLQPTIVQYDVPLLVSTVVNVDPPIGTVTVPVSAQQVLVITFPPETVT